IKTTMTADSDGRQVSIYFVARRVIPSASHRLDDLADCVDYESGLLHLDGVPAVRVADVLRVEKLREAILSGSPRRPCLRSSGAKIKSFVRGEHDNRDRVHSQRGCMEQIEAALMVGRFQTVRFDQLLRGFDVRRPLRRRQRAL